MSVVDQQDGRALFMIITAEYGGKYDDGAIVMAAQDAIVLNIYTGAGPFRAPW